MNDEETLAERITAAVGDVLAVYGVAPGPAVPLLATIGRLVVAELAADEARTAAVIDACGPPAETLRAVQ